MIPLLLAIGASAHNHPFVGEHANASAVQNENGSFSVRLQAKPSSYNKHKRFISEDGAHQPQIGLLGHIYESLFEVSEPNQEKKESQYPTNKGQRKRMHEKLGAERFDVKLDDPRIWTGQIYMGDSTWLSVNFDTANDWVIVQSDTCVDCEGNTYNIRSNLEYGFAEQVSEFETMWIGWTRLEGRWYKDSVCLMDSACADYFTIFLVESSEGYFDSFDGIVGMARYSLDLNTPFVEALAEQGVISANKFSFYIDQGWESWVDFGEPVTFNIRRNANYETIQFLDDYFWSSYCEGVAIGILEKDYTFRWQANEENEAVKENSIYTIMDSSQFGLLISNDYYHSLINIIAEYNEDASYSSEISKCERYPTLWFMMDQFWVEISAEDYVFEDDDGRCNVLIYDTDLPMNVFGTPLYAGYYTIHDPTEGTVSFGPHFGSKKKSLSSRPIPSKDQFIKSSQKEEERLMRIATVLAWILLLILGIVIGVIYFWEISAILKQQYGKTNYILISVIVGIVLLIGLYALLPFTAFMVNLFLQIQKEKGEITSL